MDQVVLRVLSAEVQRRKCPGCGNSLRQAAISAQFAGRDKVQLHFRCRYCVFEGGGEIELTPELYKEAARTAGAEERVSWLADPISADEMISVHELLAAWDGNISQLLTPPVAT
jgi:hypothetical protein